MEQPPKTSVKLFDTTSLTQIQSYITKINGLISQSCTEKK